MRCSAGDRCPRAPRHFQDVKTSGGFGNLQKGYAIAFADLEGNGGLETVVVKSFEIEKTKIAPRMHDHPH